MKTFLYKSYDLMNLTFVSRKILAFRELFYLRKASFIKDKSLLAESFLDCGTLIWSRKNLSLWNTSLIIQNSLWIKKKCLFCGKMPWWRKNLFPWKTSLINEKPLYLEKFPDQEQIFVCGKLSWLRKNKSNHFENKC